MSDDAIDPMSDDAPEPFFEHDEPGPRFSVLDAARRIVEPNEAVEPVANQLRNQVQRNLVAVRAKKGSGRTAYNLFAPADLATAKVLRTLTQFGVADNDTLRAAYLACYAWHRDQPKVPGAHHPITAALDRPSEFWTFRLDIYTRPDTGGRGFVARVAPATFYFPVPSDPNVEPMGSILVPIYRFAPRILAAPAH